MPCKPISSFRKEGSGKSLITYSNQGTRWIYATDGEGTSQVEIENTLARFMRFFTFRSSYTVSPYKSRGKSCFWRMLTTTNKASIVSLPPHFYPVSQPGLRKTKKQTLRAWTYLLGPAENERETSSAGWNHFHTCFVAIVPGRVLKHNESSGSFSETVLNLTF